MKAQLRRLQPGDVTLQLLQDATQAALDQTQVYQPGDATKWVRPVPSTLSEALDRMAALLVTLNGGSLIP